MVELQRLLKHWDVYGDGDTIGNAFDRHLEGVVKNWQHRVFLKTTGIVDALTWQTLYTGGPVQMPTLKLGSSGEAVVTVQQILHAIGISQTAIDGNFCLLTDMAVRDFQGRRGLVIDGIVGHHTWHALSKVPH